MEPRDRLAALEELATRRGLDWKERVRDLPDDERVRAAALATVLGLDAHVAAFHPEVTLADLEAQAARDEREVEEVEEFLRTYGPPAAEGE